MESTDNNNAIKLFVGNLALDTSQEDLLQLFAPYGQVVTCSVLRQFAFIHLQGEGAADRAIRDLNGREFRGRNLVVEESRGRPLHSTKVFVGNLSAMCSAEDLQELFQTFGKVLECDKVKARLSSSAGYAFVHMERKEDALVAIEALHGTTFKGRPLSVELSKVQPSKPTTTTAKVPIMSHYATETPSIKPHMEHHQSQAAVLAAAVAAAAGLPLQVQQSLHNSVYNTTSFDPTYAALKGMTSAGGSDGTPVSPAVYGALASQVYGSVADQVLDSMSKQAASYQNSGASDTAGYDSQYDPAAGEAPSGQAAVNPAYSGASALYNASSAYGTDATAQAIFEAARARFFQQGQQVLAEQQAGTKSGDRDRSPVRRSTPLLPDPVPQAFPQPRPKRRALLPTPPGRPEDPAAVDGDPIARCYAEYYQQVQQYQQYQQYQQQYQQYQYGYPPPPTTQMASHQMPMQAPPPTESHHLAAPSAYAPPRAYDPPPSHKEPLLHRPDYSHLHMPEPPYR
ncbi:RNA-binding protein 14a [Esox lucius]|uniref:RNA-binding protein 14 n=1 Tax=Esox lucius TaxID=8010 RepID=A0AAY5KLQ3_ESOLU|nr:RNA-binding protein 14a [Esox lucius]XP_019903743.1 RNA-binding protein 14a [Esox lucius]